MKSISLYKRDKDALIAISEIIEISLNVNYKALLGIVKNNLETLKEHLEYTERLMNEKSKITEILKTK